MCLCVYVSMFAVVKAALQSPREEDSTGVLEAGLWAIGSLASGNAANLAQLTDLGAHEGGLCRCYTDGFNL